MKRYGFAIGVNIYATRVGGPHSVTFRKKGASW